jgi:hypothetical protein
MLGVRQVTITACVLFAACGGKTAVPDERTSMGGLGGSVGTSLNTTSMPSEMNGLNLTGTGMVIAGTGGGFPNETACGPITCGPGSYCCNASCGICTLPDEGCDLHLCAIPLDAGPAFPVDSGGLGGDPPPPSKSDYGNQWKDSWFIRGCPIKAGHDCITIPICPNTNAANFEDRGAVTTETFPIGGTPGRTYSVTFQVNGISEAKYYQGGTRDAGDILPVDYESADLDMFYRGGTPVVSNYGVMRMRVLDSNRIEVARYYMNSASPSSGMESHRTFHLSYSKTIDVPGDGFVEYLTQDRDCHSTDNCNDGNVTDTECIAARGIPHEEANPLPRYAIDPDPAHDVMGKHISVPIGTLNSVNGDTKPWHSQIVHVTITQAVMK